MKRLRVTGPCFSVGGLYYRLHFVETVAQNGIPRDMKSASALAHKKDAASERNSKNGRFSPLQSCCH